MIKLPLNTLDYDTIISWAQDGNCTHPAGHCYGSDGGTGIPVNLKVASGRGGSFIAWQMNKTKTLISGVYQLACCQYCQRYRILSSAPANNSILISTNET